MNNKKISRVLRVTALILAMVLLFPVSAMAVEPRSSLYLDSYSAYVYNAAWGKIQVWFDITGTGDMDEIGALEIWLYESKDNENWTWIKTYEYQDYSGMLGYNDYTHTGHIEYSGTIGRYYKAYVCVWAGKNGDGDTRYFWTNSEKATLFAG
ncbi:MAG: hypothetical protein J6Q92_03735 [Oscillospiraceae bacterium]|nr:hypothetical protein [Oscillospiraceae bacterium]